MSPEITYFLKVNIAIILFYTFYRLFCRKDTFFHWRRALLFFFFTLSLIYPLLNIQDWIKSQDPIYELANLYATIIIPEIRIPAEAQNEENFNQLLINIVKYIYVSGALFLFIRFLSQIISICSMAVHSKKATINGITIKIPKTNKGAFSFFGWIFITPESFAKNEINEILTHELAHVRQHHSLDVVFSELFCIVCWINPFSWLLKREIRYNLEYMADNKVLESGYDRKDYQYHLLGLTQQTAEISIYNNFNSLSLKNRISMMNKRRTKNIGRTKYFIFLLLGMVLMLISNIEAVARATNSIAKELIYTIENNNTESPGIKIPQVLSQNKKINNKGRITDELNKPLSGTSILIKDNTDKTRSDKNEESVTITSPKEEKQRLSMNIKLKNPAIPDKSLIPLSSDEEVMTVVEKMPEYPGGMKECLKFLGQNIRYPVDAYKNGIEGRVIVQFVVNKDGIIVEPVIVRSISPELDNETIRVITQMPKWKPGMQRGKAVPVKFTLPVTFRLADETKKDVKEQADTKSQDMAYSTNNKDIFV